MKFGRYDHNSKFLLHDSAGRGFTLVELLVTIGILATMVAVTLPALSGSNRRAVLLNTAEQVRLSLYEARSLALGPAPDRTPATNGYRWRAVSDTVYQITETDILDGRGQIVTAGQIINQRRLPAGLSLTITPPTTEITFLTDDHGRVSRPQTADGRLILTITDGKTAQAVSVELSTVTGQATLVSRW